MQNFVQLSSQKMKTSITLSARRPLCLNSDAKKKQTAAFVADTLYLYLVSVKKEETG